MSQRLLEDGTSLRLLQDGTSKRLLEDGAAAGETVGKGLTEGLKISRLALVK